MYKIPTKPEWLANTVEQGIHTIWRLHGKNTHPFFVLIPDLGTTEPGASF